MNCLSSCLVCLPVLCVLLHHPPHTTRGNIAIDLKDNQKLAGETNNQFKYIFVAIDMFTRFVYAVPMKDKYRKKSDNRIVLKSDVIQTYARAELEEKKLKQRFRQSASGTYEIRVFFVFLSC